jgi:hypothetical protein
MQAYTSACVSLSVLALDDYEWLNVIDYCSRVLNAQPTNVRARVERAQVIRIDCLFSKFGERLYFFPLF